MKWSFQALYDGVHPMQDDLGRPWPEGSREERLAGSQLAGGKRGILYYLTGDLDYDAKALGLPDVHSRSPCFGCPCNLTDMPWFELRRTFAEWMNHCYTPSTKLPGLCALFDLDFVSLASICPDWLHDKNLGTDQYFYGSVLWLLVYTLFPPGTNAETAMAQVEQEIVDAYDEMGEQMRFENIKLSSLTVIIGLL